MIWPETKMLCGARYRSEDVRVGRSYTLVLEDMMGKPPTPLSGPIFLIRWPTGEYIAHCNHCGEATKRYKVQSPALKAWAHRHRCSKPEEK